MLLGCVMLVLFAIGISAFEIPPLWKQKQKRELVVYGTLLLSGTFFSLAMILHLPVPNPLDWFAILIKPFSTWLNDILGVRRA
ncbi:hypothetical protein P6P90_13310 [Ectobacillus antri]|jgi:hypothetical protein|uniref:Uncharacterized protein n=1 Tax=Ectobacillus antri TaxID=2486280 RepID=A0ABT6H6F6_9BACI|nr:hypothetical protein [Ectobacillus antri]MDG4658118.1 hypothetical protein [Ectobacillus antri]MDG5754936.1 hypothetical protein [Ectobacillus antri]